MSILSNDYDINLPSLAEQYDIAVSDGYNIPSSKYYMIAQKFKHRLEKIHEVNTAQLRMMLEDYFPVSKYTIQLHFTQKVGSEYKNITFDVYPRNDCIQVCTIHMLIRHEHPIEY